MMRNINIRFLFLSFYIIALSLGVKAQSKLTRHQYIDKYKGWAIKEMKRSGVPASITLAQGILESDNGNSTLAVKANNHFGIKCHKDWKGKTYTHDDDRPNECFRKYKSADQSFKDHSDFLTKHTRYSFLFDFPITDYKNWARGLKKAGYATNKQYDKLLIKIIEENKLYKFDDKKYKPEQVVPEGKYLAQDVPLADNVDDYAVNPFDNNIRTYNRINYVVAKEGDTFESVANKNEVMPWQLYKYNEMPKTAKLMEGEKVYLQPKRKKAPKGNNYHTIAPGENMWIISQQYGIKLKSLYKINVLSFGKEPDIGFTISLRKKKKK